MIDFKLNIEDYIESQNLVILEYTNALSVDIKRLIEYFNSQYHWDGMFTFEDVEKRIEKGHYLFILYCNMNPIGYVFFEPKENGEYYLYNLYVTNLINRPTYSPIWFVNKSIKRLPNDVKYITCVCEDWHTPAHNVFIKNGFKQI